MYPSVIWFTVILSLADPVSRFVYYDFIIYSDRSPPGFSDCK